MQAIGIRMKQRRIAAGMTQVECARRLKISNGFLSYFESGTRNFSFETFLEACRILKVKPSEIFAEIGR